MRVVAPVFVLSIVDFKVFNDVCGVFGANDDVLKS
jgi:hypothetical protein